MSSNYNPNLVDGVLDLTFLDIRDENDLNNQLTEKIQMIKYPSPSSPSATGASSPNSTSLIPLSPGRSRAKKLEIKAIRLSNNEMTHMKSLLIIANHLDTSKIHWLDLSFNHFTTISEDLFKLFPNLTSLYLHANQIIKLTELKKLAPFVEMHSLTIFGNPVEEHKHYRNYLLYHCRHLSQFDKSTITKSQILKMEVWAQTYRNKLNPSED